MFLFDIETIHKTNKEKICEILNEDVRNHYNIIREELEKDINKEKNN